MTTTTTPFRAPMPSLTLGGSTVDGFLSPPAPHFPKHFPRGLSPVVIPTGPVQERIPSDALSVTESPSEPRVTRVLSASLLISAGAGKVDLAEPLPDPAGSVLRLLTTPPPPRQKVTIM
eukprot:14443236-Alexandrium_andersonii.AAC.1